MMKRCMIVDDSNIIRKVAKRILSGPDLAIVEASNGFDALAMCRSHMPEIIIVDTTLPDMEVEDFIRQAMAAHPLTKPSIHICLIQFDVGAIMRAKRAGAKGYILKPFDRTQLLEQFREMDMAS